MFDQLFERASTIARHATAPFAEERIRYLDYCGKRGDSYALKLRKAYDLLWIARKLSLRTDLQLSIDEVRALVADGSDREETNGPKRHLPSTRKRLIGHACAWLRYLGCLREPVEQIPFGSRLDEYCNWAKRERGLTRV